VLTFLNSWSFNIFPDFAVPDLRALPPSDTF